MPDDQTFCAALERALEDSLRPIGKRVEVLNFGVSGYGTAQELLMLRHYAWSYEPDAVILAFFRGNDPRNNSAELEPYKVRPFFRLENSRAQHTGGTGLGLGIARNIARAHGGDIELRNRTGGGLCARLILPR